MPLHIVFGVGPFARALVARVGKDIRLLPEQQAVGLNHIVDVSGRAPHGVNQARVGVHADVRLYAEEPAKCQAAQSTHPTIVSAHLCRTPLGRQDLAETYASYLPNSSVISMKRLNL